VRGGNRERRESYMKEQRARERKRGRSRRQERKKKKTTFFFFFLFSCLTHSWRALWRPRSRGFLFGLRQASIPKYLFLFCVYGAHVALSYTIHSTLYTPSVSLSLSLSSSTFAAWYQASYCSGLAIQEKRAVNL
jgi:hypothetical protein